VSAEDLAREAGELLSLGGSSPARALNQLAALVARQVPACSGASCAVWRDGALAARAASHPALDELFELQQATGAAPWLDALASRTTVDCPDTHGEPRWPGFAAAALSRGVRCCVTLVHEPGPAGITLTMYGARPRSLDPAQLPLAELLVAFGGVAAGNASVYDEVQRTVLQLRDAVTSRAQVDQAKGILMHAAGCTAEEALARMRAIAQARQVKVTEVAQRIIDARGGQPG
jgi:GAF domain-containing protein